MGVHVLDGNPPITVTLRRNKRAKRLSLRVSRLDGRVALTLPQRTPEREAVAFLRDREGWLRGHLSQVQPVNVVGIGGSVLLRGESVPIVGGDVKRARLSDGYLVVPHDGAAGPRVQAFLKLAARDALAEASDRYAAALGRSYSRLSIRDTRSRWGSCSSKGVLMYSWRLIMAPPAVLDYVTAHEVAHLAEMNHSPAFWAVVERLFPDHQPHRKWLKDNGDLLHRVQFD
ncbi:M48 family metallopeptidase [Yoonia sp. 208BN28-4]|uniref:M48 family metallopeptidase n=1 Tax=Yoonia sp. 208BN28-4 TaxID=3126505 RepID=UPI0030A84895